MFTGNVEVGVFMDDPYFFGGVVKRVGVGISLAFASATVYSATLTEVSGSVMVNTGSSYAPAQVGVNLAENHRLMVLADSAATIDYGSCALNLTSNQVVAVGTEQECLARLSYAPGDPAGGAGTGGGAGGGAGAGGGTATATSVATTTTATTVTTASVVAGGAVAVTAAGMIGKGVKDMNDASR